MTLVTLPNKRGTHWTPPFLISLLTPAGNTTRQIFHFMDGPHWMITRSGDMLTSLNGMKRSKRRPSQGCQSPPQKLMIPKQFAIGITNFMEMLSNMASMSINTLTFESCLVIQKDSNVVMIEIVHYTMSLVSLNCNWENGTLQFTQPNRTSSTCLQQMNIKSSKINMEKAMKPSLTSFVLITQNMTHTPCF